MYPEPNGSLTKRLPSLYSSTNDDPGCTHLALSPPAAVFVAPADSWPSNQHEKPQGEILQWPFHASHTHHHICPDAECMPASNESVVDKLILHQICEKCPLAASCSGGSVQVSVFKLMRNAKATWLLTKPYMIGSPGDMQSEIRQLVLHVVYFLKELTSGVLAIHNAAISPNRIIMIFVSRTDNGSGTRDFRRR